jgi:heat shock protein HslJ
MLTELNGNPLLAGSTISAMFTQDGKISGSAGCNRYMGSYQISGSTISISSTLATTMMMCESSLMNQETAYLKALQEAKSYSIKADQLSLMDTDGKGLVTYQAQSQGLAGTSWEVTAYNNGKQAVTSVLAGTTLTADFGEDGTLTGSSGCNSYSGSYKVDGKNISIGPLVSTKMYCGEPAGVMDQETQFLLALESAKTYSVEGNALELRTQDGALAVDLTQK